MRSRRLLIVLAVFVLSLTVAGALRREPDKDAFTPAPTPATSAVGGAEANVVVATLPSQRVVRAKLGDTVDLRVSSATPDTAKILELGLSTPVGPLLPGTITFEADQTGRFPVTLNVAGRAAGVIDVSG